MRCVIIMNPSKCTINFIMLIGKKTVLKYQHINIIIGNFLLTIFLLRLQSSWIIPSRLFEYKSDFWNYESWIIHRRVKTIGVVPSPMWDLNQWFPELKRLNLFKLTAVCHISPSWDLTLKQITCVCGHTPSTTSTTTMAPSQSLTAVDTSDAKYTWPGESIRLTRYPSTPVQKIPKLTC
jgi:hypothetical protein